MRRSPSRRRRPRQSQSEQLEQRLLLTAGLSWFDAPNLTISLAPDGTDVAGHSSTLFETMDAVTPRWNWRTAIERGFKKWTSTIDADVSITADGGQPFGTPGSPYNDLRFGDVRIAAIPINEDVYAMGIPHDEFVAGTWAGDIIFNSNATFESADDIFRIILHEAGHVLGLDHSDDPNSPMFEHGIPSSIKPTAQDKADLRELYGFEKEDGEGDRDQEESDEDDEKNNRFRGAVVLNETSGFPKRRYMLEGSISSPDDVDIYKFQGYEEIESELEVTTLVLRSAERGRLIPKVRLFDAEKQELEEFDILQNGNGTLVIQSEEISPDEDYFIMIEAGAEGSVRGQGDYHLTISSRAEEIEPRDFADGSLSEEEKESLHTVYLSRAQLLSLALHIPKVRAHRNTAVGVAVFDHLGDLIATTSAAPGDTRSLSTLLLRAGTYYVSVKARSEGVVPDLDYELLAIKSTKAAGPLPSDPTGDPAFPCKDKPGYCYPDGHESPDPTHTTNGTGTDAPDLDPYAVLLSWLSWWPEENAGAGWVEANDDAFTAAQGSPTDLDVLINDKAVGPMEIRSVVQPEGGAVDVNPDGSLKFTSAADFSGMAEFSYALGVTQESVSPDVFAGDQFGSSVDIFGNLAIVGSPYADTTAADSGAAYLFRRDGSEWSLVQELTPADGAEKDRFGTAVAIDGTTLVVTAPRDDDLGRNSGAAYVFEFDPDSKQFLQQRKLVDPNGRSKDLFGESVAIDGSTIVVGARLDDGGGTNSGSAFVFRRNRGGTDNWGLRKKLKASDVAAFTQFGSSVAISGDLVVVGARRDDGIGTNAGAAYVFDRFEGGSNRYGEVRKLAVGQERDEFGTSVAISGSTVVVGSPGNDDLGRNAGAGYFFEQDHGGTNQWGMIRLFHGAAPSDQFGSSVAIDGTVALIGSPTADPAGSNAGVVQVLAYDKTALKWVPDYVSSGDAAASGDQTGRAVAIDSGTALFGAPRADSGASNGGVLIVEDTRRDSARVLVEVGAALQADAPGPGHAESLQHAQVRSLLSEAFAWWGATPSPNVSIQIEELSGTQLGLTVGNRILIDRDAAGHGWSTGTSRAATGMHLATVVTHEVGHILGYHDEYGDEARGSMMFGVLSAGESRLPASSAAWTDQLFSTIEHDWFRGV